MAGKVSVIIAVYNIEAYIKTCLESVIGQTYVDLEIIIVNDGSTDGSLRICEGYAVQDARVKIVTKSNGGLSSARNAGMNEATGDYMLFVDGDDWLARECIEKCLAHMEHADIAMFAFTREYGDREKKARLFQKEQFELSGDERLKLIRRLIGPVGNEMSTPHTMEDINPAWNKLYKSECIKDLRFTDTNVVGSEDLWFNVQAFWKANTIIWFNEYLYHYNKTNAISLTRKYNDKLATQRRTLHIYLANFVNEKLHGESIYKKALSNRVVLSLLALTRNIACSQLKTREKKQELTKLLEDKDYESAFSEFKFQFLPLHWRVFYRACKEKRINTVLFIVQMGERLRKYI